MFDYQVSKQPHYEDACRNFATKHNLAELAEKLGMRPQVLRNKLNPEQPHQLNIPELMALTDVTEDPSLVDGFLAQLHCLPCVPVNELADDKLQLYALKATAEVGLIAAGAVSDEKLTACRKHSMVESVNSGIRYLSLAAMTMHARLQTNPAMNSVVDTVSGLSASFGLV